MAGTSSVTPDKINAVSVIKKLLDSITRRQQQLDDLWRAKKTSLEQALQLQVFDKSMQKVGGARVLEKGGEGNNGSPRKKKEVPEQWKS